MELAAQFQNQAMMDVIRPFDRPAEAKAAYYRTYLESIAPVIPDEEREAQALADQLISPSRRESRRPLRCRSPCPPPWRPSGI